MAALSAVDILHCCSLSSYKPSSPFPYFHLPASSKVSFAFSKASRPGLRPLRTISTDVEKPLSPNSPVVTREEAVVLYEDMVLARRFEEKCADMTVTFGFVHLYIGQEAVAAGFIKILRQRDAVVSTYRCHVRALCKGVPPRPMMAELLAGPPAFAAARAAPCTCSTVPATSSWALHPSSPWQSPPSPPPSP